jgi:hypothetical protein
MRAGQGRVIEDWLEQVLLLARWIVTVKQNSGFVGGGGIFNEAEAITAFTFAEPKLDPAVEVY